MLAGEKERRAPLEREATMMASDVAICYRGVKEPLRTRGPYATSPSVGLAGAEAERIESSQPLNLPICSDPWYP